MKQDKKINLVCKAKLEKYYNLIQKKYQDFIILSDEEYQKRYKVLLKINHLWQRVIMKLFIIIEFFRIKIIDKTYLIKNLLNYYYNLLKCSIH